MPVARVDRGEEREHHGPRRRGHRDVLALVRVRPRQRAGADPSRVRRRVLAGEHRAGCAARREHESEAPPGQGRLAVPGPRVPGVARVPGGPGPVCPRAPADRRPRESADRPGSVRRRLRAGRRGGLLHPAERCMPGQPVGGRRRRAEFPEQLAGRRAGGRVLGQAPLDHGPQLGRHVPERRASVDNPVQQRGRRPGAERRPAGSREREDTAEAEDVRGRADVAASGLLGRHEAGRAHHPAVRTQPGRIRGAGDAEVNDPRPVDGEQHVRRLEVAVHEARRVHGTEAACQPGRERPDRGDAERAVTGHGVCQRRASDVPGHQPGLRAIRIGVDDRRGKRPADALGGLDLLREPAAEAGVTGEIGPDQLHRHHDAFGRLAEIDAAHAARAEPVQQTVLAYQLGVPRL
jgi:hypothetical protein